MTRCPHTPECDRRGHPYERIAKQHRCLGCGHRWTGPSGEACPGCGGLYVRFENYAAWCKAARLPNRG